MWLCQEGPYIWISVLFVFDSKRTSVAAAWLVVAELSLKVLVG
jgi:hypothetical protein